MASSTASRSSPPKLDSAQLLQLDDDVGILAARPVGNRPGRLLILGLTVQWKDDATAFGERS